jgi:Tfp pilus assembly protein PilF
LVWRPGWADGRSANRRLRHGHRLGAVERKSLASVYAFRGFAYLSKDHLDQAIEDFDQVLRHEPNDEASLVLRGLAHFRLRHDQAALADFDSAVKFDPKSAMALFGRGSVKRATGDKAGGDADIAAAKAFDPDVAQGMVENNLMLAGGN